MKEIIKKIVTIVATFAIAFAALPATSGDVNVNAVSIKAPAQVKNLKVTTVTQTSVKISWSKIAQNRNTKGYAIYRNGKLIKRVSYKTNVFKDTKLKAGTKYKYTVRAYNTYKQKQFYNSKTKKWQTKKPVAKHWKGKKTKQVTKYKCGRGSVTKQVTTKKPSKKTTVTKPNSEESQNSSSNSVSAGELSYDEKWANVKKEGKFKTFEVVDYQGKKKTICSFTKDEKTKYFWNEYYARSYYLDSIYSNCLTDEELARIWREYNGTFNGNYVQKKGVTFAPIWAKSGSSPVVSIAMYNGDPEKLELRCMSHTEPYTTYGQELRNPKPIYRIAVIGKHGRRGASFDAEINKHGKDYGDYTYTSAGTNIAWEFDDVEVTFKAFYDGEEVASATISNEMDENNEYYNIGKAAVKHFKDGNSVKSFTADDYNYIKSITSDYNADMRAIEWYVRDKYTYDEFTCAGGAAILEVYSAMEYGIYGHCCMSTPSNAWHMAFRPDDYVAAGDYQWFYETNGHR